MLTAYFNPIREKSHTHYRSFDLWLQSLEIRTNDEFQQFSPESSKTQIEQFINTVAEQSDLDDWEDVFSGCDTDYDQVLTSLEQGEETGQVRLSMKVALSKKMVVTKSKVFFTLVQSQ